MPSAEDITNAVSLLPAGYVAYSRVNLCGNRLNNVPIWFRFQRHIPIAVGRGSRGPRIWISVPVTSPDDWQYVVVDSVAALPGIPPYAPLAIVSDLVRRDANISVGGFKVFSCAEVNEDELIVSYIDLSPLHLSIKGNLESGLSLGSTFMTANTFTHVETAISIG